MNHTRPLFKHIKDHDALFTELAVLRNEFVDHLGLSGYQYQKTPKFIAEDGSRLTIEPERSIVVEQYQSFKGLKPLLEKSIKGLYLVNKSDIGFRYPTAAIAGLNAPFIKRFRSEYFHQADEDRSICRPLNLSYGIKSRGKADNRQEYEIWVAEEALEQDAAPLFIDKYGEDLPDDVRQFASSTPIVHGWMGVKRAAFEAVYVNKKELGDIAIIIGLSVDAYNIGANPDLSYSEQIGSSIAVHNAELEWEIMGYYAPLGSQHNHQQIWHAIDLTLDKIGDAVNQHYQTKILTCTESKTERILSTIHGLGITEQQILDWNLKPAEFLQTTSSTRAKAHDPTRQINLLGRLNRLFYQEHYKLPSLSYIHELIGND
jgi:hypothetical protein